MGWKISSLENPTVLRFELATSFCPLWTLSLSSRKAACRAKIFSCYFPSYTLTCLQVKIYGQWHMTVLPVQERYVIKIYKTEQMYASTTLLSSPADLCLTQDVRHTDRDSRSVVLSIRAGRRGTSWKLGFCLCLNFPHLAAGNIHEIKDKWEVIKLTLSMKNMGNLVQKGINLRRWSGGKMCVS